MRRVGFTTTIPVEILFAANCVPVDLNNLFINDSDPARLVGEAELAGLPRSACGWIKGLFATAIGNKELGEVIGVTQGDCANTHALMELLEINGVQTIPFAYPFDRDYELLKLQMEKLMDYFCVNWPEVESAKQELDKVRRKVWELDRRTWQNNSIAGFYNHLFQVSCSDFQGDLKEFVAEIEKFLGEHRFPGSSGEVRLGYIGVPPIIPELYSFVESIGARVVYNEMQRQFSMPFDTPDIVEQYRLYTYPYHVFARVHDIVQEIEKRQLDGIIHYTQSFCFRQMEDLIFRERLEVPILTLEGDKPGELDARTKMRVESFVEMLR